MTLDAMNKVVAAEAEAKTSMQEASAASKQLISDAGWTLRRIAL